LDLPFGDETRHFSRVAGRLVRSIAVATLGPGFAQ